MMNLEDRSLVIEAKIREAGIWATVYPHPELPVIQMDISWGDWKHDHAAAIMIVAEADDGLKFLGTEVIADDGSDCYSATHRFMVMK